MRVAEEILRGEVERGGENLEGKAEDLLGSLREIVEWVERVWGGKEDEGGERGIRQLGCECLLLPHHLPSFIQLREKIRAILSLVNRKHRLRLSKEKPPSSSRSHTDLISLQSHFSPSLLPPPSPAEYIHEGYLWFKWGEYDKANEFIGHGWVWRPRPIESADALTNMASNALTDYDVIEDGFVRLRQARVIVADYSLLRKDFPSLLLDKTEAEIDDWIVENAAFLSAGQVSDEALWRWVLLLFMISSRFVD